MPSKTFLEGALRIRDTSETDKSPNYSENNKKKPFLII
ncbi:hypothetical protein AWRI1631_70630 [Saccharomyces cerevisiae AWRI1631]|uniref:Uncharacterized protein n=1 Tax=Saccharomyces cerevisiae (strain AWRI1631) TaxID=545124 RepID=B5VIE1_YEAS6|nr:hypothetical protein AWRI1631_70630 [Saccharomyces cerevisiae AWRI1631]